MRHNWLNHADVRGGFHVLEGVINHLRSLKCPILISEAFIHTVLQRSTAFLQTDARYSPPKEEDDLGGLPGRSLGLLPMTTGHCKKCEESWVDPRREIIPNEK